MAKHDNFQQETVIGRMLESRHEIGVEERRRALEEVASSRTFARSEQLRRLLLFLGEAELGNRPESLTEYHIAERVLGRKDFTPTDDSTVRNRTFALRKKLQEYYEEENRGAPVRVELSKGSYRPRFVRAGQGGEAPARANLYPPRALAAGAAAGVVLTLFLAAAVTLVRPGHTPGVAAVLRQAWGPLLDAGANPLVCVATPAALLFREYPDGILPGEPLVPATPELQELFQQHRPVQSGGRLYLMPSRNTPLWGDALAAALVWRLFSHAAIPAQVLPERVSTLAALRARNVVLIGTPEYSRSVQHYLRDTPFTVAYSTAERRRAITGRGASEPLVFALKGDGSENVTDWGLITVVPSDGAADTGQRTVIFSGVTSAGSQAAAEFFCSPVHMSGFLATLHQGGVRAFPRSYQIVVRSSSDSTLPLDFSYQTHRIIQQ